MAENKQIYRKAMDEGHSAAWDQNWDLAVKNYRLASESIPNSHQAINSLGLALFELGQFEEAKLCYLQASKLIPDNPLPIERLAEIHERIGSINEAIAQSMIAADMQLKRKDVSKALDNWNRVIKLNPNHVKAHSRLALVYERLGKKNSAISEYISVAALLQDSGRIDEALKTVERGLNIDPTNLYIQEAYETVKSNKTLKKPKRQPGNTGPLTIPKNLQIDIPSEVDDLTKFGPNPIAEARQLAITQQAEFLFELSMDSLSNKNTPGVKNLFGRNETVDIDKIALHLGSAIDFQTKASNKKAADHLKKAIDAGVIIPAVYFNLGYLYLKLDKEDNAIKYIQKSISAPEYSLASHLLLAEYWVERKNLKEAVMQYVHALKEADTTVVDEKFRQPLRNEYDSVIDNISKEDDQEKITKLGSNIVGLIMQNDWRTKVTAAREQLPDLIEGTTPSPLSVILMEASDTEILTTMADISQMIKKGNGRSAMEKAFTLLDDAPTYLPLHIQMAEIALGQNNTERALDKMKVVAKVYAIRGDVKRAYDMHRKVINLSPMDIPARNGLINYLLDQSAYEEAVREYIELADTNYQLAQLSNARATYEKGLILAKEKNLDIKWSIKIYKLIADIDTQSLDWRKALKMYEELQKISANDAEVIKNLFSINMLLGNDGQAQNVLDNYLQQLNATGQIDSAVKFLENIILENAELTPARSRLAEHYQKINRVPDAISQWNKIVQKSIDTKNSEGAKQALRAILVLNPPDADKYRKALQSLN